MGLPEGWVTALIAVLVRSWALGNGVVPQQASAAVTPCWRERTAGESGGWLTARSPRVAIFGAAYSPFLVA